MRKGSRHSQYIKMLSVYRFFHQLDSEFTYSTKSKKVILTGLTLHGAHTSVLEEQPVVHFVPLPRSLGKANLVLRVVPLDKVLHDAPRLEEIDLLAIGEGVGERWNAPVGVDGKELYAISIFHNGNCERRRGLI